MNPVPGVHGSVCEITFRFFHTPRLEMFARRIVRGTAPLMSSWLGPGKKLIEMPDAPLPLTCAFVLPAVEEPIKDAPSMTTFCVFVTPAAIRIASDASSVVMFVIFALCNQPACGLIEMALAPFRFHTPSATRPSMWFDPFASCSKRSVFPPRPKIS